MFLPYVIVFRRLRIFFLPFSRPRKLRREIISRILAIEYLQLVINIFRFFPYFTQISTILYFILTITASSTIWFSQLMTNPPAGYLPLAAFYPIKFMTSLLVLYGLYTDTGIHHPFQVKLSRFDLGFVVFWINYMLQHKVRP